MPSGALTDRQQQWQHHLSTLIPALRVDQTNALLVTNILLDFAALFRTNGSCVHVPVGGREQQEVHTLVTKIIADMEKPQKFFLDHLHELGHQGDTVTQHWMETYCEEVNEWATVSYPPSSDHARAIDKLLSHRLVGEAPRGLLCFKLTALLGTDQALELIVKNRGEELHRGDPSWSLIRDGAEAWKMHLLSKWQKIIVCHFSNAELPDKVLRARLSRPKALPLRRRTRTSLTGLRIPTFLASPLTSTTATFGRRAVVPSKPSRVSLVPTCPFFA